VDTVLAASPDASLVNALAASNGRRRRVVPIRSVEEAERVLGRDCGVAIVDGRCDFALELLKKIKVEGLNGVARMPVILIDGEGTNDDFQIVPEERVAAGADARTIGQLADELMERRARRRRLFLQEVALELATSAENVEKAGDV